MKRVLITGAAGALGQALIKQLHHQHNADIFITTFKKQLNDLQQMPCDIRDINQLVALLDWAKPDIIFHLAATFTNDLMESHHTNVIPTAQLLNLIYQKQLKTRMVLIGSAAEYGVIKPEDNPLTEAHTLCPVSVYGVSKAWQTQLMGLYANLGVDVVCARLFNLFGPGISDTLFAGRIQKQIQAIKSQQRISIEIGALTAIRDYISTTAAADQLVTIALYGLTNHIYHVGSGQPITMRDFLLNQLTEHGLATSLIEESPVYSNHNGYDVPVIFPNMQKTKNLGKSYV